MFHELIGKEIAGKYRIDNLIRETELGDFYGGSNVVTGAPVTIKILAPAMAIDARYVERFLTNVNAAATVSHQHILNTLDIGTDPMGLPFAVYEGTDGENLAAILKRDREFSQTRAVGIAKQVAAALAAAHAGGVIHGGLNPDKIIVSEGFDGDTVKLYDFGVRSHSRNSMSAVPYLAPEQTSVTPATDARSDIYSLGIILYRMLAGETPYSGSTPAEVITKQANEPPPPMSAFRHDLHAAIEPVIIGAIARDPDNRYPSMLDLDEDLSRIAGELGVSAPAAVVVAAAVPATGSKRNVWQTAFIVLAGITVLAAALIYATSVRQTNPTANMSADPDSLPVQPINPATGAQEDALSKLGDLGDASLVPSGSMEIPPGTLPGGDGYNAWANGGVPPAGAPLAGAPLQQGPPMGGLQPPQYVPPAGQTVTIDPNGGSQFMPNEGGVILVPVPKTEDPAPKPSPSPRSPAANTTVKPTPGASATPAPGTRTDAPATGLKPLMTPPPKKPAVKKPNEE